MRQSNKIIYTSLLLTLLTFLLSGKLLASYDKKQVEFVINMYCEMLTTYSNAPNYETAQSKRRGLNELFDHKQLDHAFDLFGDEGRNNDNFESYVRIIEESYDNKILVEFNNLYVFSCTAKINGKEFAYVLLDKKLKYIGNKSEFKDKEKNVKILIGINVSTSAYKIDLVVFPEEYKSNDENCIINVKQDQQNVLYEENMKIADIAFYQKDYVSAKQFYEKATLFMPNDSKALSQLNICNSIINYESYLSSADKYFTDKNYSKAKKLYEDIVTQFPDMKEYSLSKIKSCNEQINFQNFNEYKKIGDENYNKEFYSAAVENYKSALTYRPNDEYILLMIKKCANADKSKVDYQLKNARKLVSENKKSLFPDIIEIYTYYEPSGQLTGQDYYNMAAILDVAYHEVIDKMNYTKVQSYHLAKEYCLKSIAKGYDSANALWYDRFNKKARNQ